MQSKSSQITEKASKRKNSATSSKSYKKTSTLQARL